MIEIFKALSLVSLTISGVYMALLLRPPRGPLHKAYALFLAALSLPLAYNYLRLSGWPQAQVVEAFAHSMLLAYGPILWSIVRITVKKPVINIYWQAAPFISVALFKLFFYQGELSLALSLLFFAHISIYAYLSVRDLLRYKRLVSVVIQHFPFSQQYWLLWFAGGIAAIELLDITLVTLYMQGITINPLLWQSVMFGLVCYVLVITTISFLSPRWLILHETEYPQHLSSLAAAPAGEPEPSVATKPSDMEHSSPTQRATELSEDAARELAATLRELMTEQAIYQQNDLALDDIAKQLNISRHHTSELLNVHIGEPFYDYLNRHRIDHACELLAQNAVKLPILQIAFESGFNNKNSFYKSFKSAKGCTPSEYRKRAMPQLGTTQKITAHPVNSQQLQRHKKSFPLGSDAM